MACIICFNPLFKSKRSEACSSRSSSAEPADDQVISLECGHVYHQSCINNWLQCNPTASCPSCRKYIHKNRIRKIYLDVEGGPKEICDDCTWLKKKVVEMQESNYILQAQVATFDPIEQNDKKKIEELNVEVVSLRMSMRSLESANSSFAATQAKYNKEIDSLRKGNANLQKQNDVFMANHRLDKDKNRTKTKQVSELRARNEDLQKQNDAFMANHRLDKDKIRSLTKQVSELRARNEDLQKQNESCLSDQQADKTLIQDLIDESVYSRQNEAGMLERMASLMEDQRSDKTKIRDLTNEVANLTKTNEAFEAQIATFSESQVVANNEETEDLKKRNQILEAQNESLLETLRWSKEKYQDLMVLVGKLRKTEKTWLAFVDLMERSEKEAELN